MVFANTTKHFEYIEKKVKKDRGHENSALNEIIRAGEGRLTCKDLRIQLIVFATDYDSGDNTDMNWETTTGKSNQVNWDGGMAPAEAYLTSLSFEYSATTQRFPRPIISILHEIAWSSSEKKCRSNLLQPTCI